MTVPVLALSARVTRRRLVRRVVGGLLVGGPFLIAGILCVTLVIVLLFASGQPNQAGDPVGNACVPVVPASQTSAGGLDREQVLNAQTIVAVGRQMKVPAYGWVVAVATAMQESGLHNLNSGHLDSVGLFQQRAAWGSSSTRLDPASSARMFYTGGQGAQSGLLQIQGWQSMPLTLAAQAVQRSAFPDAYARWQQLATAVVGDPGVQSAVCTGGEGFAGDGSQGSGVVSAALAYLGTPYSWGGGGPGGPGPGFGSGAGTVGFDCSSLVQYAWQRAGGLPLPRVTDTQAAATAHLGPGAPLRGGDLLFFRDPADPPGSYHHVGIYDGNGNMVHAPRTGKTVEVVHDVFRVPYYASQFALATRPAGTPAVAIAAHG